MGKCFTLLHPKRKLSLEIKVLTFGLAGLEVVSSSAFISYVLQVQVLLRSCQTNLISSCNILPFPLLHYLAQIEPNRFIIHLSQYSASFINSLFIRNQNVISVYQSKDCFNFEMTLCHLVSSYILKPRPTARK